MLMKNSRFIGLACLLNGCAAMIGRNEEDLAACSCTRLQHMFTQSSIVHVKWAKLCHCMSTQKIKLEQVPVQQCYICRRSN